MKSSANTTTKKYYSLARKIAGDWWGIEFGSYIRKEVQEEYRALRESGVPAKDLWVFASADSQESINAELAKLPAAEA